MRPNPLRRPLLTGLLTPAAAVLALGLAATGEALAPRGRPGEALAAGVALLCAAAAALHRPLGGTSLGLGAMVLAPAVVVLGAVPAGGIAGGGLLVAELLHRLLARHGLSPYADTRRLSRVFQAAGEAALAALAAGAAWVLVAPAEPLSAADSNLYDATAAGAAAYLLVFLGLRLLAQKLHRPHQRADALAVLKPLGLDLAGWCAGAAVAVVASNLGPGLAGFFLALIGLLAVEGLRNARLSALSHHRANELEEVSRAGQRVVSGGHQLTAMVEGIRRECAKLLSFAWFHFELTDEAGERGSWFTGPDALLHPGRPQPDRIPPALPGIHKRSRWKVLAYPLEAEGRALARLHLWCDPRSLETRDVGLLEALLPQLAASVHRVLLDREAKRDPLTGLAVRRVLERRLAEAHERCLDAGGSMAAVMCDLDHFKQINDTFGHTAGDRALIAVGRLLASRTRDKDLCCRYGGEEFILLLEETDGDTALAMAERLRREVEVLGLVVEGQPISLTLSAGVAAFPDLYVPTPEELPLLADAALYEAKRQGRNLCLLNLGRGRYRTAAGTVLSTPAPEAPAPPRLFA